MVTSVGLGLRPSTSIRSELDLSNNHKEQENAKLDDSRVCSCHGATGAAAQDIEAGATSFKKCAPCHAVGEGKKSGVGPLLNGLDGRRSGSVDGYSYTDANKNSGIVWDEGTFREYIKDPRAKIPGTKMVFTGIKNEKEADDLWAYLKQFGPDGATK